MLPLRKVLVVIVSDSNGKRNLRVEWDGKIEEISSSVEQLGIIIWASKNNITNRMKINSDAM